MAQRSAPESSAPETGSLADRLSAFGLVVHATVPGVVLPRSVACKRIRYDPKTLLAALKHHIPLPYPLMQAVPRRQADYLAGRCCAALASERLTGNAVPPTRAENGAPQWSDMLCGSISHSQGEAIAVVGPRESIASLGVDIEGMVCPEKASDIADLVLTSEERARFADRSLHWLVTLVFSLKEAVFKAVYPLVQTMFYHLDAEVLALRPDGAATLRLRCTLAPAWPAGRQIEARWAVACERVFSLVVLDAAETLG